LQEKPITYPYPRTNRRKQQKTSSRYKQKKTAKYIIPIQTEEKTAKPITPTKRRTTAKDNIPVQTEQQTSGPWIRSGCLQDTKLNYFIQMH
jgi:hypothetical protein